MALDWIKGLHDKALVEGIEDILAFEESRYRRIKPTENICVSAPLREVVKLMDANLEEPLELDQLAVYAGRSRASSNGCSRNNWAPRRSAITWNCG